MSQPNTDAKADAAKALTVDHAAKKVRRIVIETVADGHDDQGKARTKRVTKRVAVRTDEVLDFKDYGSHVVVVTVDGQKLSSADEA